MTDLRDERLYIEIREACRRNIYLRMMIGKIDSPTVAMELYEQEKADARLGFKGVSQPFLDAGWYSVGCAQAAIAAVIKFQEEEANDPPR